MSGETRAQWEDCKVCGGDHWTKDHPTLGPEFTPVEWLREPTGVRAPGSPDALPDLRTAVDRIFDRWRDGDLPNDNLRPTVLALIPEGAVLVTEEARDALLGELMESPLPGARYAHSIVEHWLARLRDTP